MPRHRFFIFGAAFIVGSLALSACGDGSLQGATKTSTGHNVALVKSTTAPPATPTGFVAQAVGQDTVDVSWNAPPPGPLAPTSYTVDLDFTQEVTLSAATTEHAFVGLASGQTHKASIQAIGAAGPSGTATATVTLAADAAPVQTSAPVITTTLPAPSTPAVATPSQTPTISPATADRRTCEVWTATAMDISHETTYIITDAIPADGTDLANLSDDADATDRAAEVGGTKKLRKALHELASTIRTWVAGGAYVLDAGPMLNAQGYPLERCAALAN